MTTIADEIIEVSRKYQIAFYALEVLMERLKPIDRDNELYSHFVELGEEKAAELASQIFWIRDVSFSKIAKNCFKLAYPGSEFEIPITTVTLGCELCLESYESKTKNPPDYLCPDCKELLRKVHKSDMPEDVLERAEWVKKVISLRKLPYKEYLNTDWWKMVRENVRKHYGGKCMLCSSFGELQVHHNSYDRLGCEKYSDLILLCKTCHSKIHGKD